MCCIWRIYHFKISHWLERLKHCPLGAYFVLIFCLYLFHWDIFLYFIFNILWFWKSRTWSESFFWYCISRVLANTWGIIWMANTIDIQHRTLAWKKKMLCPVTFKYNQMMILIQKPLPIHFYSNSTDKNLT